MRRRKGKRALTADEIRIAKTKDAYKALNRGSELIEVKNGWTNYKRGSYVDVKLIFRHDFGRSQEGVGRHFVYSEMIFMTKEMLKLKHQQHAVFDVTRQLFISEAFEELLTKFDASERRIKNLMTVKVVEKKAVKKFLQGMMRHRTRRKTMRGNADFNALIDECERDSKRRKQEILKLEPAAGNDVIYLDGAAPAYID